MAVKYWTRPEEIVDLPEDDPSIVGDVLDELRDEGVVVWVEGDRYMFNTEQERDEFIKRLIREAESY